MNWDEVLWLTRERETKYRLKPVTFHGLPLSSHCLLSPKTINKETEGGTTRTKSSPNVRRGILVSWTGRRKKMSYREKSSPDTTIMTETQSRPPRNGRKQPKYQGMNWRVSGENSHGGQGTVLGLTVCNTQTKKSSVN